MENAFSALTPMPCRRLIDVEIFGAAGTLPRELLNVASGCAVFTTIQKFFPDEKGGKHPLLSDRRSIVVIADEAHRGQYDFIRGFVPGRSRRMGAGQNCDGSSDFMCRMLGKVQFLG